MTPTTSPQTYVNIELYLQEEVSPGAAKLFDNGNAAVAITVYYKVVNGTSGTVGIELSPNSPVDSIDKAPTLEIFEKFDVSEAESASETEGPPVPYYSSHYANTNVAVQPSSTDMQQKTFFVKRTETVSSDLKPNFMAYVQVTDFVAASGETGKEAYVYSNMACEAPVIYNSKTIQIQICHKEPIKLSLEDYTGGMANCTYDAPFDYSFHHLFKVTYDDSSLEYLPGTNNAKIYDSTDPSDDDGFGFNTHPDSPSKFHMIREPKEIAAFSQFTNVQDQDWLTRIVCNNIWTKGKVTQEDASDGGTVTYNFTFESPYVGSLTSVQLFGILNPGYYETIWGSVVYSIEDVYGSRSKITVSAVPNTHLINTQMNVSLSSVEHA